MSSRAALYGLSAVGAATLLSGAARLLCFLKTNYLTHANLKKKYGKAGGWAVVTGASEGIGHAMALDLGRRGFNVCVIARTQEKLDAVVEELKAVGVEGKAISFDFSTAGADDYAQLFAQLDALEIAVLVNNVGINYPYVNYFEEVPADVHERLLKTNCEPTIRLTQYVLPKLKAKGAGAIVCLSSYSALTPTPMLATYAGTKAFVRSFSDALHYEAAAAGVDVLTVTPNVVVSKMTQGRSTRKPKETFAMVNADAMAHQTLDKLGSARSTDGHRNHTVLRALAELLPTGLRSRQVLKLCLAVKKRVEARAARDTQA